MTNHAPLAHPPISEALIDFRFAILSDVDFKQLDELHEQIREQFPEKKVLHEGKFAFRLGSDPNHPLDTSTDHAVLGFRYESEDGKKVAQFRLNGFTYSRLAPYPNWEDMRDEAKELWEVFVDKTSAEVVTRVATRFINVIRIPLPLGDFSDYLTAPPTVPEKLPQSISSFLERIVLENPEIGASAIVTQALNAPEQNFAPVVLDIDTIITKDFPVSGNEYWDRLEDLRKFKNEIFFRSITKKTMELFQ